jgi:hypothetical protein
MFETQANSRQDFSVSAYQRFNSRRRRRAGALANAVRALGYVAASAMRRFLDTMYESRRRQVIVAIECYCHVTDPKPQPEAQVSGKWRDARDARIDSYGTDTAVGQAAYGMRIRCSITGAPREGDRAHFYDGRGCARKGDLSPISHENF